jgi:sn-glycerol 3-phosphate transport system ATP-binding protein
MGKVVIRDIKKSYGKVEVLHGINIDIADGEFVVIVGPSGCGKSTLLRMVAGLEVITSGDISIDERIVNEIEPKDRNIAMVFQNYALYPHMSVFDNMAYGLKLQKLSKVEIRRRVEEVSKTLQLEEFLKRKPRQLSGGQRQRVAMGRAIVREPAVFLFDEPLSNLDAKLRVQMRLEIKKLQRRLGVTALYVTHDQIEAMTMADRLIVLNDGVAEQIGTPMELYDYPASQFVAGFIGSPAMNFIAVELQDETIHIGDTTIPCPAHLSHTGPAILGVRPEHFKLPDSGLRELNMNVDVVEKLGADTLAHGTISGCPEDIVAKLPGDVDIDNQSALRIAVDLTKLILFDPQTGRRLG